VSRSFLPACASILTRLSGVALLPVYFVPIIRAFRARSRAWIAYSAQALATALAAIGTYVLINKHYHGEYFHFLREYAENPFSGKTLAVPLVTQLQHFDHFLVTIFTLEWDSFFMMTAGWAALLVLFAVVLWIAGIRQGMPAEYHVFTASALLFITSYEWGVSDPRYLLMAFPLFIIMARLTWVQQLVTSGVFIVLLLHFSRLYTMGAWAF
jgi:hypothetical protein